jgi:hypothetical protein
MSSPSQHAPTQQPAPHRQTSSQPPTQVDDEENDWKSLKFRATLATKVKGACELLQDDGSNYVDWEYRLSNYVKNITVTRNWLTDKHVGKADPKGNIVVQQMIEHTIPTETARKIEDCKSAYAAMNYIKSLFFFPSRSAHAAMFKFLVNIKMSDGVDINNYFRLIRLKFSDMKRAGFVWNEDSVMGMIFQLGLPSDYSNINMTLNA